MPPYQKQQEKPEGNKSAEEGMPPVCQGCMKWERFGKGCWVFWEKKKVCTFYEDLSDPNKYYNGDAEAFWLR